jgi:choline dehydrogenase
VTASRKPRTVPPERETHVEYDDIVIGAGSGGGVIASRLTEDPDRSVLLLEAGPDYSSVEAMPDDLLKPWVSWKDHDWGFKAEAVPGREINLHRGKVVGGSSAVNGTIALRGVPGDFEDWVAMGNDEWDWQSVLPYYRRLERDPEGGDFHGTDGPIPIERLPRERWQPIQRAFYDACRSLGFPESWDQNLPDATGVGPWPRNRADGNRISTNIAYLMPARERLNLAIRGGCLVHRLLFDGSRAVGAEVESGGRVQSVYGRRIILAAGTIQSPAILLRSGVGPADKVEPHGISLRHELPGVGENLIDHFSAGVHGLPAAGVQHDPSVVTEIGLRYTADGSDKFNDMQLAVSTIFDASQVRGLTEQPRATPSFGVGAVLQRTRSRGRLTLRSADAHAQPQLDMHYASDPEDMRRLIDGVRLSWELMHSPELEPLLDRVVAPTSETMESDALLAEYIRATTSTTWHVVGTCKMGPDGDAMAVVDQRGRVRGLEGLFVADASIMPDIVSCNTNLTTMMIGERIAEWLSGEPAAQTPYR